MIESCYIPAYPTAFLSFSSFSIGCGKVSFIVNANDANNANDAKNDDDDDKNQ